MVNVPLTISNHASCEPLSHSRLQKSFQVRVKVLKKYSQGLRFSLFFATHTKPKPRKQIYKKTFLSFKFNSHG